MAHLWKNPRHGCLSVFFLRASLRFLISDYRTPGVTDIPRDFDRNSIASRYRIYRAMTCTHEL